MLQSDLKGQPDDEAREALLLRTRAQLADPDSSGVDELLKSRRDQALQRYLDGGSNEIGKNCSGCRPKFAKRQTPKRKTEIDEEDDLQSEAGGKARQAQAGSGSRGRQSEGASCRAQESRSRSSKKPEPKKVAVKPCQGCRQTGAQIAA